MFGLILDTVVLLFFVCVFVLVFPFPCGYLSEMILKCVVSVRVRQVRLVSTEMKIWRMKKKTHVDVLGMLRTECWNVILVTFLCCLFERYVSVISNGGKFRELPGSGDLSPRSLL